MQQSALRTRAVELQKTTARSPAPAYVPLPVCLVVDSEVQHLRGPYLSRSFDALTLAIAAAIDLHHDIEKQLLFDSHFQCCRAEAVASIGIRSTLLADIRPRLPPAFAPQPEYHLPAARPQLLRNLKTSRRSCTWRTCSRRLEPSTARCPLSNIVWPWRDLSSFAYKRWHPRKPVN